jgi:general secretion pathway protein G
MKRRRLIINSVILLATAFALWLRSPHYLGSGDRVSGAREATLKQDLLLMREAIRKYGSDKGQAPESLQELVSAGYMRVIPLDPLTQKIDWTIVPAQKSRNR